MKYVSRQVVLKKRPEGAPQLTDFDLIDIPLRPLKDGEILLKTIYFSLDPYMRARMNESVSYVPPFKLGQSLEGSAICEVVVSKSDHFKKGEVVHAPTGWQTFAIVKGENAQAPVDVARVSKLNRDTKSSLYLGALGMPGFSAFHGLMKIGEPKKGETLVVGSATGPVGSMVGQLAKTKGCRVVGIAGGRKKCQFAIEELGFDACIDHYNKDMAAQLKKACPQGIDIYFENIGGPVLKAVVPLLNLFARIPVCGAIHWYNDASTLLQPGFGPSQWMPKAKALTKLFLPVNELPVFMLTILSKRLKYQGFINSDHYDEYDEFIKDVAPLVLSGDITVKEDIVKGIEKAPQAFIGMLKGENFGKVVIEI